MELTGKTDCAAIAVIAVASVIKHGISLGMNIQWHKFELFQNAPNIIWNIQYYIMKYNIIWVFLHQLKKGYDHRQGIQKYLRKTQNIK